MPPVISRGFLMRISIRLASTNLGYSIGGIILSFSDMEEAQIIQPKKGRQFLMGPYLTGYSQRYITS